MSHEIFRVGECLLLRNDILVMVLGKMFDPNFLVVRCLLSNKGRCSHEKVIHTSDIIMRISDFPNLSSFKNIQEFKQRHPEEYL